MDFIITNARLLTMDSSEGWATALAVSDGRITAVGTDDQVAHLESKDCRRIDLAGRALLPGFHDCHCHMLGMGQALNQIDLSPSRAPDIASLLQRLHEDVSANPSATGWIRGRGYDQNRMAEHRHPTLRDLDTVSVERPIVLTHASGHAIAVNSAALRLAGIDKTTPDPVGGFIERDPVGLLPTGVLTENAMQLVFAAMPKPAMAELVAALGLASVHLASMGITSASEAAADISDLAAFQQAAESGVMAIRCHPFVLAHQLRDSGQTLTPQDVWEKSHPLIGGGIAKIFSDGALTTRTAYLRHPYFDRPQSLGAPIWEHDELMALVQKTHAAGWQIAMHAIGDQAIDLCLEAYQEAQSRNPRFPARHRIEHAMLLWDGQIGRMVSQDITPVFQPEFLTEFGDAYLEALGEERTSRLMPYRSVVQTGYLPLAFSSDLPVVAGHPLNGVAAAVLRRAPSGRTVGSGERVTPYEALRAYTYGAAYAAHVEDERGRLSPGQQADLVVLSSDPTGVPVDEWQQKVRVELTAVGGEPVFGDWETLSG